MLTRIVTAVLAGSVALAAILWREPWGMLGLVSVVLVAGGIELGKLLRSGSALTVLLALSFAAVLTRLPLDGFYLAVAAAFWVLGVLGLLVWSTKYIFLELELMLWLSVGLAVAIPMRAQTLTSAQIQLAPNLLLLALLPLWVGDSLAYFIGKAWGKHKMAPNISPSKTWEGATANLVGCLVAAYGLGALLGVSLAASIAVGFTTGILGQVGDLLQSRLKRLADVKDSGSILPGHGGVLDRLDSFLFSSYPSLLALWLLAPDAFHVKQWPW